MVITSVGCRSGKLRKNPVMRVEHEGAYLAVASKGGSDDDPVWAHNFRARPEVDLQDGADKATYDVRELVDGPERDAWWERAVADLAEVRDVPAEDRPTDPALRGRARLRRHANRSRADSGGRPVSRSTSPVTPASSPAAMAV